MKNKNHWYIIASMIATYDWKNSLHDIGFKFIKNTPVHEFEIDGTVYQIRKVEK